MKKTIELHKRWKDDPSKGEVFTPEELVKKMLDKIPTSVWENPTSTFLDPCMGKGTFLIDILRRLTTIYGYSVEDAMSRIYGYDVRVKYINYLNRGGFKNVFHKDFLNENIDMKFDVVIGNPPYQSPKKNDKKGKGGNNSLYIKFIIKGMDILKDGGVFSFVTPPAALIKSTEIGKKSKTMDIMIKNGSFDFINLDTNKYFNVASAISNWQWVKGGSNKDVVITSMEKNYTKNIDLISYLPPKFNEVEISLFDKIVSNRNGQKMIVKRSDNGDVENSNNLMWMCRFGYNYPSIGRNKSNQALYTDVVNYEFLTSKVGKWYLSFIQRHDAMTYHNLLTGIYNGSIELTYEENKMISDVE